MEIKYPAFETNKKPFMIIAGPCSIENKEQMDTVTKVLTEENIFYLRGGIYKMRTHPDSFQGLGEEAIHFIQNIKKTHNLKLVSEIVDPRQLETLYPIVDIFQVGTRNMYNYELLKELGKQDKPVLLKRAFSALVKEWLLATDYLVQAGNEQIILCERGIRTFETSTRNTLDLSGALIAQKESSFPVIVDPSHGTGNSSLVIPMALAATAAGLDGLLVEFHPEPKAALSDGYQALNCIQFKEMISQVRSILNTINRNKEGNILDESSSKITRSKKNIQFHSS